MLCFISTFGYILPVIWGNLSFKGYEMLLVLLLVSSPDFEIDDFLRIGVFRGVVDDVSTRSICSSNELEHSDSPVPSESVLSLMHVAS